jgi:hypothetical protein
VVPWAYAAGANVATPAMVAVNARCMERGIEDPS